METRPPFPNHPQTRRRPNRVASPSVTRTPVRRLDDRTREIGRAGGASARLVLAACSRQAPDRFGASNDEPTDGAPIDCAHRGLTEAA